MLCAISQEQIADLRKRLTASLVSESSLQGAAQSFVEELFASYQESLALARVYAVLPAATLPNEDHLIAANNASGVGKRLSDGTPVLSLLGSAGAHPSWNNRRTSQGHRAIPLLGSSHINEIPMVAGLLSDLGVDLGQFDTASTNRLMLQGAD